MPLKTAISPDGVRRPRTLPSDISAVGSAGRPVQAHASSSAARKAMRRIMTTIFLSKVRFFGRTAKRTAARAGVIAIIYVLVRVTADETCRGADRAQKDKANLKKIQNRSTFLIFSPNITNFIRS